MTFRRPSFSEVAQKNAELFDRTEKNRKKMIESELSVIEVFCDRAETELRIGHRDRAKEALCEAKKAVDEALLRLNQLRKNPENQRELAEQLKDLQLRATALDQRAA